MAEVYVSDSHRICSGDPISCLKYYLSLQELPVVHSGAYNLLSKIDVKSSYVNNYLSAIAICLILVIIKRASLMMWPRVDFH